ncbi:MAG: OmpP1/FadL family transporter [Planctomycetaceae bacterium]
MNERIQRVGTKMWRRRILLLLTAVALSISTRSALADGVVRDSVGAVSSGRGGANIAHSDNGAIILSNPAAMVNIPTRRLFEFGIDSLITDLRYSDPENNDRGANPYNVLPNLSYIKRTNDSRFAYGIGFYVPAGFGATWDLNNPILGRNGYKPFAAVAKILPSAAVKLNDRLSIGATLGVAVSHAELESPFFLQTGILAGVPAIIDIQGTEAAPTWSLGLQYKVNDRTTVGLTYQSQTRFTLNGRGTVNAFLAPGAPPISSRFDVQTDMAWPRSVGFGLAHDVSDNQRLSMDIEWYQWSRAFDRIDLRFSSPSNPFFAQFGPNIRDSLVLDWKDSVSVRLGYEWFLDDGDVFRVGYIHSSEVIPSSTLSPLIPATLENTFSVGYGKWKGDTRFDIAYQYAFGPTRRVGVNRIVGGDFNFSTVKAQTHWLFLGWTRFF